MNDDDAFERGMRLGMRLGGQAFRETIASLEATDAELARYLVADGYGKVLARGELSLEDRELSIIAALACRAHLPQLKWHIGAALNIGVEPEAIREVLVQELPYSGWPTTLNALGVLTSVLTERGMTLPRATSPALDRQELRRLGLENGGRVYANYAGVEAAVSEYDPELPSYLTESSYGQIYGRPGLTLRQRELVAIAMLTAQQQLTQLRWHIQGALRVGCKPTEAKEVIVTMLLYLGWPSTLNALEVWREVTSSS